MTRLSPLLYESEVSLQGQCYGCDRITVDPKPLQQGIPAFIAEMRMRSPWRLPFFPDQPKNWLDLSVDGDLKPIML